MKKAVQKDCSGLQGQSRKSNEFLEPIVLTCAYDLAHRFRAPHLQEPTCNSFYAVQRSAVYGRLRNLRDPYRIAETLALQVPEGA